ncbi:hypothetical protein SESBI_23649 [Sesbania bispinosa]|nr:hypothetical protein SESBI_23649 [Sesbania bispinosa]
MKLRLLLKKTRVEGTPTTHFAFRLWYHVPSHPAARKHQSHDQIRRLIQRKLQILASKMKKPQEAGTRKALHK